MLTKGLIKRRIVMVVCIPLCLSGVAYAATNKQQLVALEKLVKQQQHALAEQKKVLTTETQEIDVLAKRLDSMAYQTHATVSLAKPKNTSSNPQEKNPFVIAGNKVTLHLSGVLNQAVLNANDGNTNNTFIVTNDNNISYVNLDASVQPSPGLTVGGVVQIGLRANLSSVVTQQAQSVGESLDLRQSNIFIDSNTWGRLSIGKGSTASDGTSEVDLSGTTDVSLSGIQKMGGGLFFRTPGVPAFTMNPQVGNAMNNLDGFSRKNRVRYDTPSVYGFSLAGSVIAAKRTDAAIRYSQKFSGATVKAAAGYTSPQTLNATRAHFIEGSLSILLSNGLNLTTASGVMDVVKQPGRKDPHYYYIKPGYQATLTPMGKTDFSMDGGRFDDYIINGDRATVYGVQVEQYIKAWNAAIYLGYRHMALTRPGATFGHINAILAGARLNFG